MRSASNWLPRYLRAGAVLLLLGLGSQTEIDEPFDIATKAAPHAPVAMIWRDLQGRIGSDLGIVARCRTQPGRCTAPGAREFLAIVKEAKAYDGLARIGHINRAVNLAIRMVVGELPFAWTSPLAALTGGVGDCKQFAVVKYAALADAGLAMDDVRLLIVQPKSKSETHAVVAVRFDRRWVILDNGTQVLADSNDLHGVYRPLYSLDYRGVRAFSNPALAAAEFVASPCATEE